MSEFLDLLKYIVSCAYNKAYSAKYTEKRRKNEIKNVLKRGIVLLMCIMMIISACMPVWKVNAQSNTALTASEVSSSKVVNEIINAEITISLTEKIALKELEEEFPEEMEVILSDGSKEKIPVTWICECDYENEEYDSYVFEISLPDGYEMSDTCSSAFILVTLEGYVEPEVHRVYEANPDSTVTIDEYLGADRTLTSHLEYRENSTYYLGTKYYGGFSTTGIESCLVPRGASNYNGTTNGMNCTGFVAKALRSVGADVTKITTRLPGHYANASNWNDFVDTYNIKSYRFTSISSMLSSGVLKKGDIIYFEPDWTREDDDCHIGIFWGDSSSENKFWHSTSTYDNAITTIQSKSPIYYIYVFPVSHDEGNLEIYKSSADSSLTDSLPDKYSLAGAKYGVYYKDEDLSEPEYIITTDENGYGKVSNIPWGNYYVKELEAPMGFELDTNWYPSTPTTTAGVAAYTVTANSTVTVNLTDEPVIYPKGNVEIVKSGVHPDDKTNTRIPLEGIQFVFQSKTDGNTYTITTDANGEASTELLGGLFLDTYTVTEKNTPSNYVPCDSFEVTLTEDGQTLFYEIDNEEIVAAITIVKKDAKTKEIIKVAGTEFRILNSQKEVVVDDLVTDDSGTVSVPERLPCGTYYLEEVKAPSGYLKGELLEFTISESAEWNAPITLEYFNERGIKLPETGSGMMIILMLLGMTFMLTAILDKKEFKKGRR